MGYFANANTDTHTGIVENIIASQLGRQAITTKIHNLNLISVKLEHICCEITICQHLHKIRVQ